MNLLLIDRENRQKKQTETSDYLTRYILRRTRFEKSSTDFKCELVLPIQKLPITHNHLSIPEMVQGMVQGMEKGLVKGMVLGIFKGIEKGKKKQELFF